MVQPVSNLLPTSAVDRPGLPEDGTRAPSLLRAFLRGDGRIEGLERYGTLAARVLLSQIFLLSGVMKVLDPAGTASQMEGRGELFHGPR